MRKAKIVCTLGPSVAGYDNIRELVLAGMDVARLNFSHGDHESHRQAYENVRRASAELDRPVGILADLSGPKIRLSDIEGDKINVARGETIVFSSQNVIGSRDKVGTTYSYLSQDVSPNSSIYVDDGQYEFLVTEIKGEDVVCEARSDAVLRSRKGLNIPRVALSTPALTEKDKEDIAFAKKLPVDFFALSFVRRPQDVIDAQRLTGAIPVIAKIEKPSAIDHLDEIVRVSDGLMVARGDLGIEVGNEKVPLLQKRMIRETNKRGKPVIVATQMLESMVHSRFPTRAEVSDVANAVLDGTDALMLSAESAAGRYPFEAVRTMAGVIEEVERSALSVDHRRYKARELSAPRFRNAIANAAASTAAELGLRAVVVFSETGLNSKLVSAYRPATEIVSVGTNQHTLSELALYWGISPFHGEQPDTVNGIVTAAERILVNHGLAKPGDEIAITFGLDDGGPEGTTTLKLWRIRESAVTRL